MASPVLSLELLLGSRRNRLATFRRVYAALLILQFAFLLWAHWQELAGFPKASLSQAVGSYLQIFVVQYFILLVVTVPAYLAGAITDEKVQGTLQLLLTTDLTPLEIVVGKLLARLLQIGALALVGVPLLCVAGAFYGVLDGLGILGLLSLTLAVLLALGSVGIWISVRSLQTRDAALRFYLGLGLGTLAVWAALGYGLPFLAAQFKGNPSVLQAVWRAEAVLRCLNPAYVLEPLWAAGDGVEFLQRLERVWLVSGITSAITLGLAAWRLRPACVAYLEGTHRRTRKAPVRQAVDEDPIRWRERNAGSRLIRWAWAAIIFLATTALCAWFVQQEAAIYFLMLSAVAGIVASFIVGIRASGSISGERERQTWDSLLISPLDTWDLVVDKRAGILESSYPFAGAFALPALGLSLTLGTEAVAFTVAMLLLSWTTMYYMASTGVWCSASSRGSWRSLVNTLMTGYGYCLGVLTLIGFAYGWVTCMIVPVILLLLSCLGVRGIADEVILVVFVATCLFLCWRFYRAGDVKLWYAKSFIDAEERYGRTLTRSLTRALRKHYQVREDRQRATSGVAG